MTAKPAIEAFFDEPTFTVTYLVSDPATGRAAIVDPVRDYDHKSGKASTASADRVLASAHARGLAIDWILETHAHADHLTAAPHLRTKTGAKVVIGEHIRAVQKIFKGVFNAADLSVEVAVGFSGCLDEEFQIVVTVRNEGSLGVPAGVNVTLYEGTDETGMLIGTQQTMQALLPGEFVQLVWFVPAPADMPKTFFVAVDDADLGTTGMVSECDETNNTAITETVACPTPG